MTVEAKAPALLIVVEAWYPTEGGGGAEVQVRSLARNFAARGIAVTVCAPLLPRPNAPSMRELDGVPVHRIEYPGIPVIGGMIMLIKLALYILREGRRFDAIHSHIASNMSAVCCLMGRIIGRPVIVKLTGLTELSGGILDPQAGLFARLRRAAIRKAYRIQAISKRIAGNLVEVGFQPEQVLHIPNSVDMQRFDRNVVPADVPQVTGVKDCALVGVFVGRLHADKNIELLLQGWARTFKGRSDVCLMMLGAGNLKTRLEAMAKDLGIGHQVRFLGAIQDVERYLKLAHFGILTSKAEGLSNTMLEYMSSGLPVVGSIVSGNEDFIVPGTSGWLFPATDEDAFVACLEDVARTPRPLLRSMGQNARAMVQAQAALPAVLDSLMRVYGMPIGGNPSNSVTAQRAAHQRQPADLTH